MGYLKILISALVISFCHLVKGKSTFGKCSVYAIEEQKPQLQDGMGRHCENSKGPYMAGPTDEPAPTRVIKSYCLNYKCPPLNCDGANVVKVAGKCDRCKGDCEWLENIVKNGTEGLCEDGCNRCGCMNGAVTSSTYIGCTLFFCYDSERRG